jgi:hypothetical protein
MRREIMFSLMLAGAPLAALAGELPVRSVTLSNAGLVQLERSGTLAREESASFRVPLEAVDDVLKSLVVRDAAGRLEGLRLPARELEAEAFRGLPLRPADFASRVSLLQALRGHEVEAGGGSGRLANAEETQAGLRLSLLTDAGMRSLMLRDGDEVKLRDRALAARLRRAAEALATARSADEREIEVRLRGTQGAREVSLTTVTPAPLWKPSWRLLLPAADGPARLLGWAVVENRSGADWEAVRLALVSGNPAAFHQALYAPITLSRPELPVRGAEQVQVLADTGGAPPPPPPPPAPAPAPMPAMMRMAAAMPAAALPPPAPAVAETAQAQASASAGRVAFALAVPVSLRNGETANLPFLDTSLPAERLWWVQGLGERNPLNAVRLRNTASTALPDGLVTVYGGDGPENGGYLGDAELRAVAPGESRLLAFARDRDVQLTAAFSSSEKPLAVQFRPGVVVVRVLSNETAALAVAPRGGRGKLVLDLPRRPGLEPRFAVLAEGDFGLRTEAMLEGTDTTLRFAWEREMLRELPLWDAGLGDPVVLRWRDLDLDQAERQLPGGPGTLETLQTMLAGLPANAEGRERLAQLVQALGQARQQLAAARSAIAQYAAAEAALERARAAVEDRVGPAKERARQALGEASQAAGRAGLAADRAWEAWQRSVQAVR